MRSAFDWARTIKRDVTALYLAGRDSRTPWAVRMLALLIVAYALSPIDLIPDFIPLIGYLDDLLLVPLGIVLIIRLIPSDLMNEFRQTAESMGRLPHNRTAAAVIVALWLVGAAVACIWLWSLLANG